MRSFAKPRRHECPRCKRSETVFRSRPRWWEQWWLSLNAVLPYRCASCRIRFYRKPIAEPAQPQRVEQLVTWHSA